MKFIAKRKSAANYGSPILNAAYEKFINGQHMTYEEFVLMLSTNDELWFMYNDLEYFIEHTGPDLVSMCATRIDDPNDSPVINEPFVSVIDLLDNFRINGKRIRDVWENVSFTNHRIR
ncbi:MAG: hypothetical protein J6A88_06310 [Oscillospiraceae bacterium]|nr:hypothetical protein [Oscillospiraceae bacterium]